MALKYQTIYSTLPCQALVIDTIKTPILEAVATIFDQAASKFDKLRAANKLWRAFKSLCQLPKPTKENTWHPNSHNIIDLRDWLMERLMLGGIRKSFVERMFNLVIIIYDFDPPWRWVIDSVINKAFEMEWKPRGYGDDWYEGYHWWNDDGQKDI